MEKSRPILYSLIIFFLAILVLISGCTTTTPTQPVPPTTPIPSAIPTTIPVPISTAPQVTQNPTLHPVTTTPSITSDDITQHFMDVAFGSGTTQLDRLAYNPTGSKPRNTLSLSNGNNADMALLGSFITEFNDLSATNQISENIKTTSNADIVIQFVAQSGMGAIPSESYTKEFKSGSVSYAKIGSGTIYINDNLKGDLRTHIILRSFLYELGCKGETLKYPDSMFYYDDNTNIRLSLIDKKAVQIMYGAGLYRGMTVADVKNVVNVRTY
jgi:hypothetical protein